MLSATLAVLCWAGLVATDPTATAASPEAPLEASQDAAATGTVEFEIQFECCDELESLGRSLFTAVGVARTSDQATATCQTQCGVARSACCQCVGGRCTTASGESLQSTCVLECEGIQLHQACPAVSGTVIQFTGQPSSLGFCPTATSLTGDDGQACPWVAEGSCHVRELGAATSLTQPTLRLFTFPCGPAPFQQTSQPQFNAFVVPAPAPAPHNVLYANPAQGHPAFVMSNNQPAPEWTQHPEQPADERGRITHLQEAARHLEAAGMHGEANQLRQRAQEMEHHARRMLEEKESQLRQLQQEIEMLQQVLGHEQPQTPVSIHSDIFRVSPQGLEALREHGHGFGAGSVSRHEFRQLIEKLQQAGMAEVVARPQFVTSNGQGASFQCRMAAHETSQERGSISCDLSIHPVLHDGCCRLEVHPQLRTNTNAGIRMESAQLTADLDPSQGLLAELTDDGSLLAFITWEHAAAPQPTAAVPAPVTTQMLVPASAEIHQSSARLQHFNLPVPGQTPHSGQIIVTPVFPQPFPARVPQSSYGLQVPQPPVPAAQLVPPSPDR